MKTPLDRLSILGLVLTAIMSPCCFPLFGVILASLGLGSFELFGGWTMYVFQGFVLLSLLGTFLGYRKHRCMYPSLIAIPSALLIFYAYYFLDNSYWLTLTYIGMGGLVAASLVNYYRMRLHNHIELHSEITCPNCHHKKVETMPVDACTFFYECTNCKVRLKPLQGDCCVFCSFGSHPCPPIQQGDACC